MVPLLKNDDGDPRDIALEVELRELRRLAHLRRTLEAGASAFAEYAPKGCHGDCEEPVKLGVMGLTCCCLYLQYLRYTETLRLEHLQRQVVEGNRARHRRPASTKVDSPLHDAYYRDFTGTGVMKRLEHNLQSDEGAPEVNPQVSLKDTLRGLK